MTNMTFQLQPNVFFRHRVLGFYGAVICGTNRRTPFGCARVAQRPFRSFAATEIQERSSPAKWSDATSEAESNLGENQSTFGKC